MLIEEGIGRIKLGGGSMKVFKCRKGFTLVEVLLTTAIFLIAVLAISGVLMQGYRAMGLAGKRSEQLHITQAEIEAVIASNEYISEKEDVAIEQEDSYISVFGKQVGGTLITVRKSFPGNTDEEITYTYFLPDDIGGK